MAMLDEDLRIIQNAVYGKEMRPAISDALIQSWDKVKDMMRSVENLNARVDALVDDGGGDKPEPPIPTDGSVVSGEAVVSITCSISIDIASGEAITV